MVGGIVIYEDRLLGNNVAHESQIRATLVRSEVSVRIAGWIKHQDGGWGISMRTNLCPSSLLCFKNEISLLNDWEQGADGIFNDAGGKIDYLRSMVFLLEHSYDR